MKKLLLALGGLGLLGTGLYLYLKKQSDLLSQFDYKIAGVKIKRITLVELSFDVILLFTNKSAIEAKVNRIYVDLFLEGKNVGYVTQSASFIIPANGSSNIPLSVSINPQSVLLNITDILLGTASKKDMNFSMKGFANIKSGFVSITMPIEYQTSLKEYLKGVPTL